MPKNTTARPVWDIQLSVLGGKVSVTVPKGCEANYMGADIPQIVDAQLAVHTPLTDTRVQLSFICKNSMTGESQEQDVSLLVKGEHGLAVGEKPCVIPEPAQWYAFSAGAVQASQVQGVAYTGAGLEQAAAQFADDFQCITGRPLAVAGGEAMHCGVIHFIATEDVAYLGAEGYQISTDVNGIRVCVSAPAGAVWAAKTLLQLIGQGGVPHGEMRDYPKYPVRGFMLDVGRRPVSLKTLRKIVDTMAWYKLNDFQVHLSDNYIFLEDYGPEDSASLAAYEAFRLESTIKNDAGETATAKDYSYSKAAFREFISWAARRGVRIVPELDVPAHALSLTKVFPEHMVKDMKSPLKDTRPLTDHLDIRKPETVEFIKRIFDEYTHGENPVFGKDVTIHIGADEFFCDFTAYRAFLNEIVPYLKQTNPVRVWGGLTWIKDDPVTPIIPEAIEDVQVNLWASDWADGREMYNMGYQLIHTIDQFLYMVPNGSGKRAPYQDYLDKKKLFQFFSPQCVRLKNGTYTALPAGDQRMLGAVFAIWNDNIDKRASGLTEDDLFDRFLDAAPLMAEKTWGSMTARSVQELDHKAARIGLPESAQNKTPQPDTLAFHEGELHGARLEDGVLKLAGGSSYLQTKEYALPRSAVLTLDIKLLEAKPNQIIMEADAPYGTYDIRITENGKLGFTREGYTYEFDYKVPTARRIRLEIVTKPLRTILKTGRFTKKKAVGRYVHNGMVKRTGIRNATVAVPLQRIGSAKDSVHAEIYAVSFHAR